MERDAHGLTAEDWGVPPSAYHDMQERVAHLERAHDALVDALREIEERLTLAIFSGRGSENVRRAHARARAALALATNREG